MINEERVRTMTKAQMLLESEQAEMEPASAYFRWDYIGRHIILSILSGTAVFILVVLLVSLDDLEAMITAIDFTNVGESLKTLETRYIVFMIIYLGITFLVYSIRYSRGKKKLRKYYAALNQVEKMYQEEEYRQKPTGGEEE